MLKDLSGVGALQDNLTTTNALPTDVLAELKETNSQRLDEIAKELRSLNEKVGKIPFTGNPLLPVHRARVPSGCVGRPIGARHVPTAAIGHGWSRHPCVTQISVTVSHRRVSAPEPLKSVPASLLWHFFHLPGGSGDHRCHIRKKRISGGKDDRPNPA